MPQHTASITTGVLKLRANLHPASIFLKKFAKIAATDRAFPVGEVFVQRLAHRRTTRLFRAFLIAPGLVRPHNRLFARGGRGLKDCKPGQQQRAQLRPYRIAVLQLLSPQQRIGFTQPDQGGTD